MDVSDEAAQEQPADLDRRLGEMHTDRKMYAEADKAGDVKRLPLNLLDALRAFEASAVLGDALGKDFVAAYLKLKHAEWNSYARHLTTWERQTTLDC